MQYGLMSREKRGAAARLWPTRSSIIWTAVVLEGLFCREANMCTLLEFESQRKEISRVFVFFVCVIDISTPDGHPVQPNYVLLLY